MNATENNLKGIFMKIENNLNIRCISPKETLALLGLKSRTSLYELEKTQNFTSRIRIGTRRVSYDLHSVLKWLESRYVN